MGNKRVKEMRQLDAEEYRLTSSSGGSSRTSLDGDDGEKERWKDDGALIATTESSYCGKMIRDANRLAATWGSKATEVGRARMNEWIYTRGPTRRPT